MMNETSALFRHGWTRYQRLILIVLPLTASLIALTGLTYNLKFLSVAIAFAAQISVLACALSVFSMFSMSHASAGKVSLNGFYDPWLLRLPIATWKLAVIPALLLTVSTAILWLMFAVPVRIWSEVDVPILSQILAMSSAVILLYSIIWRPPRSFWLDLVIVLGAVPLALVELVFCFAISNEAPEWAPFATALSLVSYAISIALAIHSVRLARLSSFQQTDAVQTVVSTAAVSDLPPTQFSSRSAALAWHDRHRARSKQKLPLLLIVILSLVFLICILPLNAGTAIFALIFSAVMSGNLTASMHFEPEVWGIHSSLPSYLSASPLASGELAFGRLRTAAIGCISNFLLVTPSLLLSLVWESNRMTAERWWLSTAESLTPSAPLRIIAFACLATLIVSLGLSLRMVCVQFYGRQSLSAWLTALTVVAIAIPFCTGLGWFLKQTDWEQVTSALNRWWAWSYNLIYLALAIKVGVDLFIAWQVDRRLLSQREITWLVAGWSAITLAVAVTAWWLWPERSFALSTAMMVAAIVVPLSPVLLAPSAVDANRHRRV